MRARSFSALLIAVFAVGCVTTKEEGNALRADIEYVREQVQTLKRDQDAQRLRNDEQLAQMSSRVRELEGTLRTLRQADADGGVQMEKVIAEVQILRGEIEEARYQLGKTKRSVEDILKRPPVEVAAAASAPKVAAEPVHELGGVAIPKGDDAHFQVAKKFFSEKKYADALSALDLYFVRHKDGAHLTEAHFLRGESLFAAAQGEKGKTRERALRQAILAYQKVYEAKKSTNKPLAMFKIGLAFEQLGFLDNAIAFYDTLVKEHPRSSKVREAKKRLRSLKKKRKKRKK